GEPGDAEDPDERIEDLAQAAVVLAEDDGRREDEKHLAGDRHGSPGEVDLDQRAESREAREEARQSEVHEEGAFVSPPIELVGRIPNATDRRSRRHRAPRGRKGRDGFNASGGLTPTCPMRRSRRWSCPKRRPDGPTPRGGRGSAA